MRVVTADEDVSAQRYTGAHVRVVTADEDVSAQRYILHAMHKQIDYTRSTDSQARRKVPYHNQERAGHVQLRKLRVRLQSDSRGVHPLPIHARRIRLRQERHAVQSERPNVAY